MLLRFTRDMIRRAARNSRCVLATANSDQYCTICIISDAVFNKLPPLVRGVIEVSTGASGYTKLQRFYDYKTLDITLNHTHHSKIIDIFDSSVQRKKYSTDEIYNRLRNQNLLNLEVYDFLTDRFVPEVREVYKLISNTMASYCGGSLSFNYALDKWLLPGVKDSKFFCFDTLRQAQYYKQRERIPSFDIYKCLAINPIKALAQVNHTGVHFSFMDTCKTFWKEFSKDKPSINYSVPCMIPANGVMYADAIKLLGKVS